MRPLDSLLLVLLVWGGYSGFRRGLLLEAFSLAALLLAALGGQRLLNGALEFLTRWYLGTTSLVSCVVFVLLFVGIFLLVMGVGRLVRLLVRNTFLGIFDGILGGILGIMKWSIYSSACLWLGSLWQLRIPEVYTDGAILFPFVESIVPQLQCWLFYVVTEPSDVVLPIIVQAI